MQLVVPDANQIYEVVKRLETNTPPSDAELNQILAARPLFTGLDHWSLWTLVCLLRHRDRQKWVGCRALEAIIHAFVDARHPARRQPAGDAIIT